MIVDIWRRRRDVRFAPGIGHVERTKPCLLWEALDNGISN